MPISPIFIPEGNSLENTLLKEIMNQVKAFQEYKNARFMCREESIIFNRHFTDEYVCLCTLLNILDNYRQLKTNTRLTVVE
jgi:hypothetical protein